MTKLETLLCEVCKKPFPVEEYPNNPTINWHHIIMEHEDKEFHFHDTCLNKRKIELLLGYEI